MLEFRTGTGFAFEVVVDRAFDLGRCELRGQPLAWTSAVGFAGPWYYEWEGLGFFRNWGGGLLTTCGIDHALFMATDTAAQYHYPPKLTEEFGLHGRVSNRPAGVATDVHGIVRNHVERQRNRQLGLVQVGDVVHERELLPYVDEPERRAEPRRDNRGMAHPVEARIRR
mgnify:CR=1 FL=1